MFKTWLKKCRARKKLTQAKAAKLLNCSAPRISEWERGVRTPKPWTQVGIRARLEKVK